MRSSHERLADLLRDPVRDPLIAACGAPCLLVGGALRDSLVTGRPAIDWDLLAEDAKTAARRLATALEGRVVRIGGRRLGVYRVVSGGRRFDLHTPVEPGLDAELRRRDLTINAIALDLADGAVHDPLEGRADIERRLLRSCSPDAFAADPLRVVRLLRFALVLEGFRIDPDTAAEARASAPHVAEVAAERLREELSKALRSPRRRDVGGVARELDLHPRLWRTASQAADPGPEPTVELESLLVGIEAALGRRIDELDLEAMRHATLLRTAGAPVEGARLLAAGWISKALATAIDRLGAIPTPPEGEPERRWWIHRAGPGWPAAAALAIGAETGTGRKRVAAATEGLVSTERAVGELLFQPSPLLSGRDLQREFGLRPGIGLGRLLAELERAQVEGRLANREEARDLVRRRLAERPRKERPT